MHDDGSGGENQHVIFLVMYNWSVDEKLMKTEDPEGYRIWRLEQMINWGLGGEKLSARLVRKYWEKLFMDEPTRQYLEVLLWPKKYRAS